MLEREIVIVIVCYGNNKETGECIDSITKLNAIDKKNISIVIVDNWENSEELFYFLSEIKHINLNKCNHSIAQVHNKNNIESDAHIINVDYMHPSKNLGFAGGVNLGLNYAKSCYKPKFYWVLNNDTVLSKYALDNLILQYDKNGEGIYGSTLVYLDDKVTVQAAGGAIYYPIIGKARHLGKSCNVKDVISKQERYKMDYVIGASLFFSDSILTLVGNFPEEFFLYYEELEWCLRARDKGVKLNWAKESIVYHVEGLSTGAKGRFKTLSDETFYYVTRNSLYLTSKRTPIYIPFVVSVRFFEAFVYFIKKDRSKITVFFYALFDFLIGKMGRKYFI